MSNTEENKIPAWLKNLQENSWELELLISGGAIFSLFQLSSFYLEWMQRMVIISTMPGFSITIIIGMFGIKILTTGFMLHLILRAFWLGLVCVNYVYPGGINGERLRFKKPFIAKDVSGDLKLQILKVDNLCGTVMYTSIISAAVITGFVFLIWMLVYVLVFAEAFFPTNGFLESFVTIMFSFVVLYAIDLLCSGMLRRIPFLSYVMYPFFKVYDLLSFRFVYRRSLALFSSNVHRWKFRLAALVFLTIAFTSTYLTLYRTMHWPNIFDQREYRWQMADNIHISNFMYRDEFTETERSVVSIQSKIVHDNYVNLFLRYDSYMDHFMNASSTSNELKWLSDYVIVSIDDSIYQKVEWFPKWDQEITNIGINAMVDINNLKNGKHELKIATDCSGIAEENRPTFGCREIIIPFWKDVSNPLLILDTIH